MLVGLDLDGTLIDSRRRHIEVARAALGECGLPVPDLDAYWEAKREGRTTADLLGDDVAEIWMREIEAPRWLRLDEPFADATTTLRAMRAAGATPLIVTARRDAAAVRNQVERLAPELLLAVVRPGITAAREKARALSGRGAAVLIGDTESDADAARTAGIPFVAVSRGQRSEAFLIARGLTPVYGDLAAAWEAVQSMTSSV